MSKSKTRAVAAPRAGTVAKVATVARMAREAMVALAVIAIAGANAAAQQRPTVPRPAPRIGGIGTATEPTPAQPGGAMAPSPVVQTTGIAPVIVGSDGRVFADFGLGYEQILRSCAAARAAAGPSQSASGAPSYLPQPFTPPAYTPPTYTPPAYTPPSGQSAPVAPGSSTGTPGTTASSTAGIAPLAASRPALIASEQARAACWTTNELGRIIVIR